MNKKDAKKAAEKFAGVMAHVRFCRISELDDEFRVLTQNFCDDNVEEVFPFETLVKGDLCQVWDNEVEKNNTIISMFICYSNDGYPLFDEDLSSIGCSFENYRKTGFNVVSGKMDEMGTK